MRLMRPWFALWLVLLAAQGSAAENAETARQPTFEKDVRPILKANCFHCHGNGDEHRGGLDLRLRRFMVERGGKSGPVVTPGKRDESLLYRRVSRHEMPPGDRKKLTPDEIALIGRWIEGGAKTARPEPETIGDGPLFTYEERNYWAFQPIRRPPVPQLRSATNGRGFTTKRIRTPIDAFILRRLQETGLTFSPDADKPALIRRATFDLIGLPPTPEEVQRFLADDSPDAYERLIERLLASPHYGERWGRHWLDVAGYADSEGYTNEDPVREWAWKYRDYVIRAFNADKPFDQFIREQLAGDEMVSPPYKNLTPDDADKLVATGFLRMAPDGSGSGGVDQNAARNQVIADTIKIVSTSLLGMTVGCAQCHDHRYDPIPQADYYRLRAVFDPAYDWKHWRNPRQRLISLYTDADRQQAAEIEAEAKKIEQARSKKQQEYIEQTFQKELAKLPEAVREPVRTARSTPAKQRSPEQKALLKTYPSVNVTAGSLYLYDRKAADELEKLQKQANAIRATKPKEEFVRALTEVPGQVPESFLFARGDYEQPKQEVEPAGLAILQAEPSKDDLPVNDATLPTTGRRLAYARYLTSGEHPLVARVIVNRLWLHHFGRGIVNTPGDFGTLGERPTHPQLLDWLASEFMQSGWSLKHLQRLIMCSTVYRQQGRRALTPPPSPSGRGVGGEGAADPDNRLYGGMPLLRMEAEVVRDSILALTGTLNEKPFGPPVPVMADRVGQFVIGVENLDAGRPGAVVPMHGEEFRRSVYVQVRRSRPLAVLDSFDWPTMAPNCTARPSSTVAPQSLMLMNNTFIVEQSERFAGRVRRESGDDRRAQVLRAWKLAYTRAPSETELNEALAFLQAQTAYFRAHPEQRGSQKTDGDASPSGDPERLALASFCQTLISSNEFLYID